MCYYVICNREICYVTEVTERWLSCDRINGKVCVTMWYVTWEVCYVTEVTERWLSCDKSNGNVCVTMWHLTRGM